MFHDNNPARVAGPFGFWQCSTAAGRARRAAPRPEPNKRERLSTMWKRRTRRAAACVMTMLMLAGCASDLPESDFCLVYEPVYVAGEDTAETVEQVMRNNGAWVALCE